MLILTSETPASLFYRRVGVGLLLVQFFLFMFALPPFQAGIWLQTEPVVFALFLCAALNALWLCLGVTRGWLVPAPSHPLWMGMVLWTAWQLIATLCTVSPWRSWFGPPETGEGTGWYMALLLLVMLAYPLWQVASCRRVLLYGASASLLVQAALHGFFPLNAQERYIPGSWRPATWAAYLAFMAGYVWIAWLLAGKIRQRHYLPLLLFICVILILSHNKSAIVLLGAAMAISILWLLLSRRRPARRFLFPGPYWRRIAYAGCILPLGWILFSACFVVPPDADRFATFSGRDGSLGSRIALNEMGLEAMRYEPSRWLLGGGWGGFSDIAFNYALVDGVEVFHDGKPRPNSLMVEGYSFHSHNQPLEALLSLGLVGMVLWFALPLLSIRAVPRRYFWSCVPMLVGLSALSNLWFELAQCLPFKALALAALCSQQHSNRRIVPYRGLAAALAISALIMGWSAWQQKSAMAYGLQLRQAAHALPYEDYPQVWVESDNERGGDRLRSSALFYASWLPLKLHQDGLDTNDAGWYGKFMDAAHTAAISPVIGASVASLELQLHYSLMALDAPSFAGLKRQAVASLPTLVMRLARKAPRRDDMATPLLLNLPEITGFDTARQIDILRQLLAISPDHRGALWVLGGILQTLPGKEAEGQAMRRRAAILGVARVYPVTEAGLATFEMTE